MLAAGGGGSIDKGQIGTIIYSAKFPLKHHLLFRSYTIFEKSNNRQFKTIIFRFKRNEKIFSQSPEIQSK